MPSSPICPIQDLNKYANLKPNVPGDFLFIVSHLSGCQVNRYQAEYVFNKANRMLGLDTKIYKTHSFHIGAALLAYGLVELVKNIAGKGR